MSPAESRDFWRQAATTYQCQMSCDFPGDVAYGGTVARMYTGAHQLLTWRSPPIHYQRTRKHIRVDDVDSYLLVLPATGTVTVCNDDNEMRLGTGSACLMTMTRPFDVTHSPEARPVVLTVPRHEIDHQLNGRTATTQPIDLSTGLGNVIHALVTSTLEQRDQLSAQQFNAVADRLIELLCLLLSSDSGAAGGHLAEIEASVRRYVREHSADAGLNGESIAKALGWSLRQIQLALQQAGTTPRDLIREQRLLLARVLLTSTAYRRTSITELAHRSGFSSASTFSTAFRNRFGVAPRDLRLGGHRRISQGDP